MVDILDTSAPPEPFSESQGKSGSENRQFDAYTVDSGSSFCNSS